MVLHNNLTHPLPSGIMADRKMKAAKAAFDVSVDCDITFFDTAEVYGSRVRH